MLRTISLTILLSGCAMIPGTEASKTAKAEDAVRAVLKDGETARFRNTRVTTESQANGQWFDVGTPQGFCGEVNSKNSFGAYSGFTRFFVDGDGKASLSQDYGTVTGEPSSEQLAAMMDVVRVGDHCRA